MTGHGFARNRPWGRFRPFGRGGPSRPFPVQLGLQARLQTGTRFVSRVVGMHGTQNLANIPSQQRDCSRQPDDRLEPLVAFHQHDKRQSNHEGPHSRIDPTFTRHRNQPQPNFLGRNHSGLPNIRSPFHRNLGRRIKSAAHQAGYATLFALPRIILARVNYFFVFV